MNLSISTELTRAVAAPSPGTPKDLAIEVAEKVAKQPLREKEALERFKALGELARSETAKQQKQQHQKSQKKQKN